MRLVDASLRGLPPSIAVAYLDNIIIPSSGSFDNHMADVGQVFDKLIESGFTVRCDKVHIGKREVPYLGFLVGAYGTRPQPEKTRPILERAVQHLQTDPTAAARSAGMVGP